MSGKELSVTVSVLEENYTDRFRSEGIEHNLKELLLYMKTDKHYN